MVAKKFCCVALDLDGTLLDRQHQLSQRNRTVLKRLEEKGVRIIIATGRGIGSIGPTISAYGPASDIPAVCYNGGLGIAVHNQDVAQRTVLFQNSIATESAKKLIDFCTERGIVVQYYNGETGEVYAAPTTDEHRQLLGKYTDLCGIKQVLVDTYDSLYSIGPTAKLLALTNSPDELIAETSKHFNVGDYNVIKGSPDPFFVEYLRPDVSKGSAVVQMCQHYGINMEQVVAFGDGDNDREMLSLAGLGVAMKNAKDAAKYAANVVLEWTNDEDGVAQQLELMDSQGLF